MWIYHKRFKLQAQTSDKEVFRWAEVDDITAAIIHAGTLDVNTNFSPLGRSELKHLGVHQSYHCCRVLLPPTIVLPPSWGDHPQQTLINLQLKMRAGCIFYSDKINWKEFIVNSRELKNFWRYFEFYTRFLLLSMSKIWGIIRKEWFVWTFNIWPTCCITKFFPLHLKKCHLAKVQIYKLSSQGFFPLDLEGRVVHLEGWMPDPANSSPLPFLSPSQSFFVTSYQYLFC